MLVRIGISDRAEADVPGRPRFMPRPIPNCQRLDSCRNSVEIEELLPISSPSILLIAATSRHLRTFERVCYDDVSIRLDT